MTMWYALVAGVAADTAATAMIPLLTEPRRKSGERNGGVKLRLDDHPHSANATACTRQPAAIQQNPLRVLVTVHRCDGWGCHRTIHGREL